MANTKTKSEMEMGKGGVWFEERIRDEGIHLDRVSQVLNLYCLVYFVSCIYAIASMPGILVYLG